MSNYGYTFSEDDIKQSKYDSGWFKVLKLNESWQNCRIYWRKGEYDKLNWELDLIWFELETDAKQGKDGESGQKDEWASLCQRYDKSLLIKNPIQRKNILFKILRQKWFFLTDVESSQGLGKRYKSWEDEELD